FELDRDWTVEEIGAALRISSGWAADRLGFARELKRMPRLFELLRAGAVTFMHARNAAREMLQLDQEQVDAVLDRVLERATEQTVGEFTRSVRRAVLAAGVEPETKRAKAYADRRVAGRAMADGMAELYAFLSAEDYAALMAQVEREARTLIPGDTRTLEQRRADALVALVVDGALPSSDPDCPKPAQRPTAVNVITIDESTLAGVDDEPAELAGHGPISAEHARALATRPGTVLRELRVDGFGRLLQYGTDRPGTDLDYARSTRTAPADLDRYIRARDVTCRFPHCTRPAATAELDHITPWSDGGTTSAANLHALCARHHHARHEGRWKVQRDSDGTTHWSSPTGHTYQVPPHTYRAARGPDPPT
ncbi:MAG TPA: DUF222 domain-containing protein, partial [Jatrophihabitantaceae bacterium]|nr:DUF222 domain-containing protein [Jatrophihabitantaceae bacterium]